MNTTYEWLHENYARKHLQKAHQSAEQAIEELAQSLKLSEDEKYRIEETLNGLLFSWGVEIFAIALQLGMRLVLPTDWE